MYISPYVVQTLHEDRIRDAQQTARRRTVTGKASVGLFERISHLLHNRDQGEVSKSSDARPAHAI